MTGGWLIDLSLHALKKIVFFICKLDEQLHEILKTKWNQILESMLWRAALNDNPGNNNLISFSFQRYHSDVANPSPKCARPSGEKEKTMIT